MMHLLLVLLCSHTHLRRHQTLRESAVSFFSITSACSLSHTGLSDSEVGDLIQLHIHLAVDCWLA